ncbi:Ca(2+)-dependent cysteine protease [Actinomortierella ambigua]|nr:Ca(2+)-dependent cysteine protease [Actinomortierella ambigua]
MDASSPRDEADIDPIILADVARVVEQLLKQGGGAGGLGDLQALLGPDAGDIGLDTVEQDSEKIIDILQVHQQEQQQHDDHDNQQYGESKEQCTQVSVGQPEPVDADIVDREMMEVDKGSIPTETANISEGGSAIAPTPIITTTAATAAAAPLAGPSQTKQNKALLSPTLSFSNDGAESEKKKKKKDMHTRNTTSGTQSSSSSSSPSILLSPGGHAFGPDREDHVYFEHPPANYYPPQVTEKLPMASSAVAYHTQIPSSVASSNSSSGVLSPSLSNGSLSSIDKRNPSLDAGVAINNADTDATTGQTTTAGTGFASTVMTTADHTTSMLHSAMLPSSNLKITRPRRKKALLIGINYFGDPNQLPGCINDTRDIFGFLNGYYGFRYQDTVMLTDDQIYEDKRPSGANIRYWMKWLVQDAEPHDSLFFHYAGHGGRVKDFSYNGSTEHLGDEADGYDEVIFPCDYLRSGIVSDDEMYDLLVKELPEGVQLTALIDSCHSGTMLDLPFVYNGDQFTQLEPHMPRAKIGAMAEMTVDEASHADQSSTSAVHAAESANTGSLGLMTGSALESVISADRVTGSRSMDLATDGPSATSPPSSPSALSASADSAKRKEGCSTDDLIQEDEGEGDVQDKAAASAGSSPSPKKSKDNQGAAKSMNFALEPAAPIDKTQVSSVSSSPKDSRSESSLSSRERVKSEGRGLHLFRKTKGNVVMFSGCRDDQASADIRANDKTNTVTKIGPRGDKDSTQSSPVQSFHQPQSFTAPLARGAVTYAWIQCLSRKPEQSYEELLQSMRFFMKQRDLEQIPQLGSGLPMDMNTIFTL